MKYFFYSKKLINTTDNYYLPSWMLYDSLSFCLRTDTLLVKLSLLVGQSVFYGALWGSALVCPLVRLPASLFIVTHFDRMATSREQKYMLGNDHRLAVSVCVQK